MRDLAFRESGDSSRWPTFYCNVGVLLYLLDCCGIIHSFTTVRALIEFNGRCGVSLALTSTAHGLPNFFEIPVAAVRANG